MWEILTGEEPYANMHCGAIIGKETHLLPAMFSNIAFFVSLGGSIELVLVLNYHNFVDQHAI